MRLHQWAYLDAVNFLSKFTFKRGYNAWLIWLSFYVSKFRGKAIHWGLPVSVSIEPTTSCNLRCPECPSGLRQFTRPTGMLAMDDYQMVVNQLHKQLWYLIFYFQGEPYLNKNLFEMIKYAVQHKIYTATSTNGHYLTDENAKATVTSGLDRLIISIDGLTQEVYEQYRIGGALNKVIEGTKRLVAWKQKLKSKTPHIIFQFLVVKPNEHQINELYQLANTLGVNEVKLKTAQVYDYKHGNKLIPSIEKYARYVRAADGTYYLKNEMINHCWKMWHSCVITWNGTVVPCCFDKDATHPLGNLKNQSFKTLWQSASYNQFRQDVIGTRSNIDICANCSEGTKVWV
ncbi:MAG: SPASM domain-containing protein [Bacteroidia bacterium]|nr:SPASM domain-containing protein [Bacteroidia bacterium]HQU99620.1 radical SAM/SPASM domain-containing protein [Bacteroidia bacterium]